MSMTDVFIWNKRLNYKIPKLPLSGLMYTYLYLLEQPDFISSLKHCRRIIMRLQSSTNTFRADIWFKDKFCLNLYDKVLTNRWSSFPSTKYDASSGCVKSCFSFTWSTDHHGACWSCRTETNLELDISVNIQLILSLQLNWHNPNICLNILLNCTIFLANIIFMYNCLKINYSLHAWTIVITIHPFNCSISMFYLSIGISVIFHIISFL